MKKIISVLITIMVLSIALIGCNNVSGKYVLTQFKEGDTVVEPGSDEWKQIFGDKEAKDCAYIELNNDETFEMKLINGTDEDSSQKGEYKVDGNNITLTVDNSDEEATLEDGKLVMKVGSSATVTFEK